MNKKELASNNAKMTLKKKVRGRPFEKGNKASKGKVKGSVDFMSQLKAAIKEVEKEKGNSLIKFAVEKAYTNPQVLIAMLKKIIPDMSQSDVKVTNINDGYENKTNEEIIEEFTKELNGYIADKQGRMDRENK